MSYEATTEGILVRVEPRYVEERSSPAEGYFFFSYTVSLHNHSTRPVQLLARYWRITDAEGQLEEVSGPGVVGQQPRLAPGAGFKYTSFCPLRTEVGTMGGHYTLRRLDDEQLFDVQIPTFTLALPHAVN